jgi:hypothetical protein
MIQKLSGAKSVWILLRKVNSVKEKKQAGHDTEAVWSQVRLDTAKNGKHRQRGEPIWSGYRSCLKEGPSVPNQNN